MSRFPAKACERHEPVGMHVPYHRVIRLGCHRLKALCYYDGEGFLSNPAHALQKSIMSVNWHHLPDEVRNGLVSSSTQRTSGSGYA